MEFIGILCLIAMIVGGGYALFKAKKLYHRFAGLFFLCTGLYICYLAISSPSSSDYYDYDYYESDGSYGSSNPSFKGKVCTGSVGCGCTGFAPITDGDVWQQSICKKCNHKKNEHH